MHRAHRLVQWRPFSRVSVRVPHNQPTLPFSRVNGQKDWSGGPLPSLVVAKGAVSELRGSQIASF